MGKCFNNDKEKMTKHTEAQIVAVAKAIRKYMGVFTDAEEIAKAAIAAAAEVGEPTHMVSEIHRQHKEIERLRGVNGDLRAEIGRGFEPCHQCQRWVKVTAAAEVSLRDQVAGIGRVDYPADPAALRDFVSDTPYSEPNDGWGPAVEVSPPTVLPPIAKIAAGKPSIYEAARATYGNPHVDIIVGNAVAATIERCAQVAENFRETDPYQILADIAAAIRKLKDA